jgi:RNA polymerase-binding transcription factor DksA
MDATARYALEQRLRKERSRLREEALAADSELQALAENRDSELEEVAQQERMAGLMARLDLRAKHEIEEIDAALMRLADGRYGSCLGCGRRIAIARLQVLPATRFCVRCARRQAEAASGAEAEAAEVTPPGELPADEGLLTDRELESTLRQLVLGDERVDREELRIVCRHGIVYLDGALPSEAERQIVRRLVTDHVGVREVVDRLRIAELLWERPERSKPQPAGADRERYPADVTEDVVKSAEEGLDYNPPDLPPEPEE